MQPSFSTHQTFLDQALDRRPLMMPPQTLLSKAIASMSEAGVSYTLIVEQQHLLGIITERDVVKFTANQRVLPGVTLSQVMTQDLITVCCDRVSNIFDLLTVLRSHKIRHLPITDEQGQFLGVVTPESLSAILINQQMQQEMWQRQQAEEQLRQVNENLEVKVAARTLALTKVNNQLKQEILIRTTAEAEIRRLNAELEHRVEERTAQLAASNQELQQTIAHLQLTQQELIHSEKMAALGQLVAGVAHEINTPLGAICSSVQNIADFLNQSLELLPPFFQNLSQERYADFLTLLQKSTQTSPQLSFKEKRQIKKDFIYQLEAQGIKNADTIADTLVDLGIYDTIEPFLPLLKAPEGKNILNVAYQVASLQKSTHIIKTATDRAAKVVFALKNYAHHDHSGEKVRTHITEGIETVLTLYHNQLKRGVETIRHYQKDVPALLCYPDELNQVWTNLIHNALQAMKYKGSLIIDVKRQADDVCVSITDSGEGIQPEILPKIFEPFFTTKPVGEGSGLGLNIVKKIVEKHQGKIKVQSLLGKTTFTVCFPLEIELEEQSYV